MAAIAGRKVRIYVGSSAATGTLVAGARTDSMTINNEMIDITDKDDSGIRTLLDDIAVQSFSMSCEGVLVGTQLADLAHGTGDGTALNDFAFDITGISELAGSFFITSFEVSGAEGSDPATFTAAFESSGTVTMTND